MLALGGASAIDLSVLAGGVELEVPPQPVFAITSAKENKETVMKSRQ
jgi:hypothetical protein